MPTLRADGSAVSADFVMNQRAAEERPLFDTYVRTGAGAVPSKITFFDNPNKGRHLTNIPDVSKLGTGQKYTAFGMTFNFISTKEADMITFFQNYFYSFKRAGREIWRGKIHHHPGGGGFSGVISPGTAAAAPALVQLTNGVASANASRMVAPENAVVFGNQTTITCELESGTGSGFNSTNDVYLEWAFWGVWEYPL